MRSYLYKHVMGDHMPMRLCYVCFIACHLRPHACALTCMNIRDTPMRLGSWPDGVAAAGCVTGVASSSGTLGLSGFVFGTWQLGRRARDASACMEGHRYIHART